MISYFVRYEGQATDRDEFIRYYRSSHVPILLRWPGIRAVHVYVPAPTSDPQPTLSASVFLMAQMIFDDEEALAWALASPERTEARTDMGKFPKFDAVVTHQAFLDTMHRPSRSLEELGRPEMAADPQSNLHGG